MKPFGFFIILALSLVITGVTGGEVKGQEASIKSFTGLVIFLDETSVEVKQQGREVTFILSDNMSLEKAPAAKTEEKLSLCQQIRVWYTLQEGKKIAGKIKILRPGYCR